MAQEDFLTIPINEKGFGKYEASFIDNDGHTALVFKRASVLLVYPFDSSGNVRDKIIIELSDSFIQNKLHANAYSNGVYNFYFSTTKNKDFNVLTYDTNTGQAKIVLLNIDMRKQRFLDAISIDGDLYLFSLVKKNWTLNMYSVDATEVRLDNYKFSAVPLQYNLFTPGLSQSKTYDVVPQFAPANLNITNKSSKIYYNKDSITFTFEDASKTLIKAINFETRKLNEFKVDYEPFNSGNYYFKANSFIKDNHIYTGIANSQHMLFYIKSLKTSQVLRKFKFNRDENISFANTGITQEGGSSIYSPESRELSKTKQLLRKVSNSTVAISVAENTNTTLEVTIGSYKEIVSGGGGFGMPMPVGGGTISTPYGAATLPTTYTNPYYYGYGNSTLSKSAFFSTVLDSNTKSHNAIVEAGLSPWKRIKAYEDKLSQSQQAADDVYGASVYFTPKVRTVYQVGEKYLFGYYNSKKKEYYLKSFGLED